MHKAITILRAENLIAYDDVFAHLIMIDDVKNAEFRSKIISSSTYLPWLCKIWLE